MNAGETNFVDGERLVAHWIDYLPCAIVELAAIIFFVTGLPWYLALGMIFVGLISALGIYFEHKFFILEARPGGLIWGSGAIQKQRSQLTWSHIVSVELNQTGLARFFGYHNIVVTTTGLQKVLFKKVATAEKILNWWEKHKNPAAAVMV